MAVEEMDVTRSGGRGGGYYRFYSKGTGSRFALSGVKKWYKLWSQASMVAGTNRKINGAS